MNFKLYISFLFQNPLCFAFLLLFNIPVKAGTYTQSTDLNGLPKPILINSCIPEAELQIWEYQIEQTTGEKPKHLFKRLLQHSKIKNKKLIAALLAFPFPFGIVGLHRIYLGTSPHVPIVYIATIGGGFGVLPLIDFFVILTSPDLEHYLNNQQVFMWKH